MFDTETLFTGHLRCQVLSEQGAASAMRRLIWLDQPPDSTLKDAF